METAAPRGWGLAVIAAVWGTTGIVGWAFYLVLFRRIPAQDWMVFYTAARAFLDGNLALIFHGAAFTAALNHRFAAWLAAPLGLHPWVYPPSFLLLFLPFGVLPAAGSLVIFEIAGFIAALVASGFWSVRGPGRCLLWLSLLLCPAVPFNVLTGQNAFYTSALLLGGFAMLARYPVGGGALLGILTFKPQLWLMVPMALAASREWRALASTVASALILALISLAVFGIHSWQVWLDLVSGSSALSRGWLLAGRLNGVSVFACAALLGAPSAVANLAQAAAIAIGGAFVFWAFSRPAPGELRLSILLAATMLAAPHASTQDAVLLGLAASLFLSALPQTRYRPFYAMVAVAVWISPLFNPPVLFRIGLITPVLLLLFLACAVWMLGKAEPSGAAMPTGGVNG